MIFAINNEIEAEKEPTPKEKKWLYSLKIFMKTRIKETSTMIKPYIRQYKKNLVFPVLTKGFWGKSAGANKNKSMAEKATRITPKFNSIAIGQIFRTATKAKWFKKNKKWHFKYVFAWTPPANVL